MKRLEELLNKFPEIPRNLVIKVDVNRRQIRYTPTLQEIGKWALPQSNFVFEADHEDLHTKGDVEGAWLQIPQNMWLPDGTAMGMSIDPQSPYEIRGENGKYMLCLDRNPIEEVTFPPRPKWYSKKTSSGKLMSTLAFQNGDCFITMCLNYCDYFKTGDACAFCCVNPTTDRSRELGIDRPTMPNMDDFVETYAEASKEARHMTMSGGGLIDRKKEASLYVKMLTALKDAGHRPKYLMIAPQALEAEDAKELHDLGVRVICHPMEVWQENLWPIIVPGKSKFVGRDKWIDCLLKAVEIFGRGNVKTNFVAGCEMAPPYGFKDIDEALESTLGGFEWLAQRGIIPRFTFWSNNPGSRFKLENVEPPPSEYYLKLGSGQHKLLIKYDLSLPEDRCHICNVGEIHYDFMRLVGKPTSTAKVD